MMTRALFYGRLHRVVVAAAVFLVEQSASAQGTLKVDFFDVGQADAILVTCPHGDHHLLIDSADGKGRYPGSLDAFRERMTSIFPEGERQLDVVVASHPHADHIGSMQWVLETFDVDTYIDNGGTAETTMFGNLLKLRRKLVRNGELNYINGKTHSLDEIDFCPEVSMRLLVPWAYESFSDINDRSVGVWLEYKKTRFLFVGDMEDKAEEVLLNRLSEEDRKRLLDVDVLKVGHHGSDTSSSLPFVQAVSPKHAVISCGKKEVGTNDGYKHPRASTIDTYNDAAFKDADSNGRIWAYDKKAELWRQKARHQGLWVTTKDGPVQVTSDGTKLKVEVGD